MESAQSTIMFRGKEVTRDEAAAALSYTEEIAVAKAREEKTNLRIETERKKERTDARDARQKAEADRVQGIADAEAAAIAKIRADKKAFSDRKAATHASESAVNEFSNNQNSYKHRLGADGHRYIVLPFVVSPVLQLP